ncbi:SDR family oxidoreductase [Arthrobacter sp. 35W]|uniref:SDR family oxidoreductase n=1 Tax=Arthrobacter sp. 35W TaxID=1132441 RepID=UPI0004048779|nr:NmrA family NAD(P)-binding protein [Arthrobacter sp. 35W]
MVLIAVAGGTGTAGRAVVAECLARGLSVRVLSRHIPAPSAPAFVPGAAYARADASSGEGLAQALDGVDFLIETLDARSGAALKGLPAASASLLRAADAAGVKRAVLLSIVHAEECAMSYYGAQAQRAALYRQAPLPTAVVLATQFHNLVAGIFAAGARVGLIPVFRGVSFQPIATADVARVLVDAALSDAGPHHAIVAGGPAVHSMKELALAWKAATGRRGLILPLPLPGSFGRFLRAGRNLVPGSAVGTVGFAEWVAQPR